MPQPIKIIVDTDIAMGLENRDVDDGLALAMIKNSPALSLEAITLTYGNASLPEVVTAMGALNQLLHISDERIALGAEDAQVLGLINPAVELMIKHLERSEQVLLAIGPLTNIATLIFLRPDLISRIKKIITVAGRRPGYRFLTGDYPLSHPDLNFEKDPKAMATILQTEIPLIFAPYELSSKVWLNQDFLEQVRANGSPLSEYIYQKSMPWLKLWQERFSTTTCPITGFNPFDCLAISCLIDSDLITSQPVQATIEEDNYDRSDVFVQGTDSGLKSYLHVYPTLESKQKYAYNIATDKYLPRLQKLLK